jgi:hypothetical protein
VGVAATAIGAVISIVGAAAMLALWHSPQVMIAIHGSGGLSEVFTLPLMMVLPGVVLGSLGGLAGATVKRVCSVYT